MSGGFRIVSDTLVSLVTIHHTCKKMPCPVVPATPACHIAGVNNYNGRATYSEGSNNLEALFE